MDKHQVMAEFSLVCVKLEDAMKYWCQYRVLEPPGTSGKSDRVKLLLTSEGSGENGGPGLFPQGHVPLVSPLCTQITGTPHPAFPSALGGTASRAGGSGFQALMGAAALQRWGPRLLQPPQIPASHGEGDGHGLPSEGTAGRFQAGCQRRALPLSQLELAALPLTNQRPGAGQKCR